MRGTEGWRAWTVATCAVAVLALGLTHGAAARAAYDTIAFASMRDGFPDIFVMEADGGGVRSVAPHPAWDWHPGWSPDGLLGFGSEREDNDPEVYVYDFRDDSLTRLTHHVGIDWGPAWSADGSRIAYDGNSGDQNIYVMDADGGNPTRLTKGRAEQNVTWVDDKRLAYSAPAGKGWEVRIVDAGGGPSEPLGIDEVDSAHMPSWSPDGRKVAFAGRVGGFASDIYVMDVEAEDVVRLTAHPGMDSDPVWSPDGRHIAFESYRDGNGEIYTMRFDGEELRNITNHRGEDVQPAWARPGDGLAVAAANVIATAWAHLRVGIPQP